MKIIFKECPKFQILQYFRYLIIFLKKSLLLISGLVSGPYEPPASSVDTILSAISAIWLYIICMYTFYYIYIREI